MQKGNNKNHPQKGSQIKVEPIKNLKHISKIKKLLSDNPKDYCLFMIGINTNLRASDILSITIAQVKDLKPGDDLVLTEKKTSKERRITLNMATVKAIQSLLRHPACKPIDYLFEGQRGAHTVQYVHNKIKSWCKQIRLKGNYGSHTLRKTWGYHQRVTFGTDLPTLMTCFNHSTQKQTLNYLCIQPEEIKLVYENEL